MKTKYLLTLFLLGFCWMTNSCSVDEPELRIGISQCTDGEWREMQNKEMLVESTFYNNVGLEFRMASDNDSLQIKDIEHFIQEKVDLLIVSPNTLDALNPVLAKAMTAGIPVVLFDRRISSDQYTTFVGANNYDIGYQAGMYMGSALNGKGTVLELENNLNSAPFRERHNGFLDAMKSYADIKIVSSMMRSTYELTESYVDSLFASGFRPDGIYGHIDINFNPVDPVLKKYNLEHQIVTVGIDGMPFPNGGIDRVLQEKQTATFVYPTGGDRIMQVAMEILQKKSYKKEYVLNTYVIDKHNVRLIRAQTDEFMNQSKKIERLYNQADHYLSQIHEGKYHLFVVVLIAILLAIISFVLCYGYWMRNKLNHRLMKQNEKIIQQKNKMQEQRDQLMVMSKQVEEATNAKLVFFTNVSHDFRTPLTLISGPLAQLKKQARWNEAEQKLYDIVQKNIGVLMRLVYQIIDFRKFENGKMTLHVTHVDLAQSVRDWGNAFHALADERRINYAIEVEPDTDFSFDLDAEKIERVLYNIIYNAFKFTPMEGSIQVRLRKCDGDASRVQIVISDSGAGMSQDSVLRIFDRFYKVDSHDAGSGIGLNLAKAFVELHGGTIQVESEVGKGTTFTIELPKLQLDNGVVQETDAVQAAPVAVSDEEKAIIEDLENDMVHEEEQTVHDDSSATCEKELVLVVDDNADIREFLKYLLSDSYRVMQACDGEQGLAVASKYVPDAIISDIMMPVMDGLEFCKRIKEDVKTSHIPVMLLTACSLDEQRVSGYESGADSYISKPFTAELLLSRIRNLIDNRKRFKPNYVEVHATQDSMKDLDMAFVRKFKDYIEKNIGDSNLSMDSLGDEMGMSRVQIYRKVKSLLGVTPSELIKEARMKKAKALLIDPACTITDVAYSVGFSSPSYFTKCYKEYYGELPRGGKD